MEYPRGGLGLGPCPGLGEGRHGHDEGEGEAEEGLAHPAVSPSLPFPGDAQRVWEGGEGLSGRAPAPPLFAPPICDIRGRGVKPQVARDCESRQVAEA